MSEMSITKGKLMKTHNYRMMPMEHNRMLFKIIKLLLIFMLVSGAVYAQNGDNVAVITDCQDYICAFV